MAVIVSVAASSSDVVAGSTIQWSVLAINTDIYAGVTGSISFPVPTGTSGRIGRGGGLQATGATLVDTPNWVSDSSVMIPASGSVWYTVTDMVNVATIGVIRATVTFTPQGGQAVTSVASVSSAVGVSPTYEPTSSPTTGYCEPIYARIIAGGYVALPTAAEAVLWVEIYSGDVDLRGGRLTMWWNPIGWPPPNASQADYDRWVRQTAGNVFDIKMPWLPASSTLTIDGRTEDMTLECGRSIVPAEPYILTDTVGFCWPILTCYDAVFAFVADEYNSDPNKARISVEAYQRFRM